ncbi:MAG: response regulator [bacterium]
MDNLKVMVVDDHPIVCAGLSSVINAQPDMKVVAECNNGKQAIDGTTKSEPDVVVLDVAMPELNGVETMRILKKNKPGMKLLAISFHETQGYVKAIMDAGASGYVLKKAPVSEILHAIRCVGDGQMYLDPSLISSVIGGILRRPKNQILSQTKDLSERETEVLRQLASGYGMKEVANNMKLSIKTVDTYKRRSFEKLGLRSRVELLKFALINGWFYEEHSQG